MIFQTKSLQTCSAPNQTCFTRKLYTHIFERAHIYVPYGMRDQMTTTKNINNVWSTEVVLLIFLKYLFWFHLMRRRKKQLFSWIVLVVLYFRTYMTLFKSRKVVKWSNNFEIYPKYCPKPNYSRSAIPMHLCLKEFFLFPAFSFLEETHNQEEQETVQTVKRPSY